MSNDSGFSDSTSPSRVPYVFATPASVISGRAGSPARGWDCAAEPTPALANREEAATMLGAKLKAHVEGMPQPILGSTRSYKAVHVVERMSGDADPPTATSLRQEIVGVVVAGLAGACLFQPAILDEQRQRFIHVLGADA